MAPRRPIFWKHRLIQDDRPLDVCGWILLSTDSEYVANHIFLTQDGEKKPLSLRRQSGGRFSRLNKLVPQGATLEIAMPEGVAKDEVSLQLYELSGVLAYPVILMRALRQFFDDRDGMQRSLRTAIRLILSAQFVEAGKRILRKSGSISQARNSEAPKVATVTRTRRNHCESGEPPRTIVFTHSLNLDGAPISQFELTVALSKDRTIVPLVVAPVDGPLRRYYEAERIEVRVYPFQDNINDDAAAYRRVVPQFARFLKKLAADLMYANSASSFLAVDAADSLHLPCVWNLRESEPPEERFRDYPQSTRSRAFECLSLADQVIFVSQASKSAWQPLPDNCRSVVIPNALDPERMTETMSRWNRMTARESLCIATDEISIICVGTLCERKGQNDIIGAVERLSDGVKQRLRIDFIGDYGDRYGHDIKDSIDDMPLRYSGRFRIFSATQDVARHYQAADIFVCSSRVESYPRVILEAMAYKLAIASTPVFGITEQLSDGETALFYTPGDTSLLAHHIQQLAEDEIFRRQLGESANKSLDRLTSFPDMVQRYADIFQNVSVGDSIQP